MSRIDLSIRDERKVAAFRRAYSILLQHVQTDRPLRYSDAVEIMSLFILHCLEIEECRKHFREFVNSRKVT